MVDWKHCWIRVKAVGLDKSKVRLLNRGCVGGSRGVRVGSGSGGVWAV